MQHDKDEKNKTILTFHQTVSCIAEVQASGGDEHKKFRVALGAENRRRNTPQIFETRLLNKLVNFLDRFLVEHGIFDHSTRGDFIFCKLKLGFYQGENCYIVREKGDKWRNKLGYGDK